MAEQRSWNWWMASWFSSQSLVRRAVRRRRNVSMGATTMARMTTVRNPEMTATSTARHRPRSAESTSSTMPKNSRPITRKMRPSRVSSTVCQLVRAATR